MTGVRNGPVLNESRVILSRKLEFPVAQAEHKFHGFFSNKYYIIFNDSANILLVYL